MKWTFINCADDLPKENEYVLIYCDGYIGISRLIDGEWDTGDFRKRPMFKKNERIMSKLDAQYWTSLPELSEDEK